MATGTYTVRAVGAITRRGEDHVRRRGGLAFGATEVLVSTDPDVEGAQVVTEEALDAILHDSNLRAPESTDPSAPGLRVKAQAPPAAAASVEDEEEHEAEEEVDEEADEEPAEAETAAPAARRRRKVKR